MVFPLPFLADEILDAWPWDILLALGILAAVLSVPLWVRLLTAAQRRHTRRLRAKFGPDYEDVMDPSGAENRLTGRPRHHSPTTGENPGGRLQ